VFVVATVLGIGVGLVAGVLVGLLRRKLDDPLMESTFGIIVPFGAYVTAEHLHPFSPAFSGSGVLAVVAAGLYLGRKSLYAGPATRVQDSQVWATFDVLLEALVFALMGLQLPFVLDGALGSGRDNWTLLLVALVVLLVTMGVRIPYVFLSAFLPQALRLFGKDQSRPAWRQLAVVSWTGMRGVITLAAATGIPVDTPGREEIQLFAFTVAIGTLLIQGLTLPPLIKACKVQDPDEASRDEAEELAARKAAMEAAKKRLDEIISTTLSPLDISEERLQKLKTRLGALVETRYRGAVAAISLSAEERGSSPHAAFAKARRELLVTQRKTLLAEHAAGRLDDDMLRKVLRELDLEEMALTEALTSRLS
jgi:CPA1 family monovalent cation:H+ antiporter